MRGSSKGRPGRLTRLFRLGFTFYLWSAAFYTAFQFLLVPAWQTLSGTTGTYKIVELRKGPQIDQSRNASTATTELKAKPNAAPAPQPLPEAIQKEVLNKVSTSDVRKQASGKEVLAWHAPAHELAHHTDPTDIHQHASLLKQTTDSVSMSEDFFLGKAFGESLQPSKVIPYYYRASKEPEQEDITITTLITPNRFKVFADLVERYKGRPLQIQVKVVCKTSC